MIVAVQLCRRRWQTHCLPKHGYRNFSRVAWPDVRFWLQYLPDNTVAITDRRVANSHVAFDAYAERSSGTREINIGGSRFFAFVAPRLGTEHFVVWRRVQDIHNAAKQWQNDSQFAKHFDVATPVRVTRGSERDPLTSAVWCWDKLDERDSRRYWDDGVGNGPWMYWASFWAPSESAATALETPAFIDVEEKMLAPLLGELWSQPETSQYSQDHIAVGEDVDRVISSTSTAMASKDRAYAIVYQFNVWGSDMSRSGTGSDFWSPEARLAVTALEAVIDRFDVRSILDCACGDATWIIPYFVLRHPEMSYCGCEIVPEVVAQNRIAYPGVNFMTIDLAGAPLPVGADLIFSKETLNHMDLEDAHMALRRFAASGARYLLTNVHEGSNNFLGQGKRCFTTYIKYDFSLAPFNMKRLATVIEYQGPQTSYSVFDLSTVV